MIPQPYQPKPQEQAMCDWLWKIHLRHSGQCVKGGIVSLLRNKPVTASQMDRIAEEYRRLGGPK